MEDVAIPLSVFLAFGFGLAVGIILMVAFPPGSGVVLSTLPRVDVLRDELGRIMAVQGGR